jgi:hypothetical protein
VGEPRALIRLRLRGAAATSGASDAASTVATGQPEVARPMRVPITAPSRRRASASTAAARPPTIRCVVSAQSDKVSIKRTIRHRQGQGSEHEGDLLAEILDEVADGRFGAAAVETFEVAVFHQRNRRVHVVLADDRCPVRRGQRDRLSAVLYARRRASNSCRGGSRELPANCIEEIPDGWLQRVRVPVGCLFRLNEVFAADLPR